MSSKLRILRVFSCSFFVLSCISPSFVLFIWSAQERRLFIRWKNEKKNVWENSTSSFRPLCSFSIFLGTNLNRTAVSCELWERVICWWSVITLRSRGHILMDMHKTRRKWNFGRNNPLFRNTISISCFLFSFFLSRRRASPENSFHLPFSFSCLMHAFTLWDGTVKMGSTSRPSWYELRRERWLRKIWINLYYITNKWAEGNQGAFSFWHRV